jgi:hypothetical protein
MGAYGSPDVAIAGMVVGFHNDFESAIAKEDIDFGSPVFGFVGSEDKCYGPHLEIATVTLSADLATGDTISVTVNGNTVSEGYDTSHAATMTAFIAEINADTDIAALGIKAAEGASNKVVVLTGPAGLDVVATASVTSTGSGTAEATVARSTAGKFLGVAAFVQIGGKDFGAETSCWKEGMSVSILRVGRIWVPAESTVADKDAAYAVTVGTGTLGNFTDVSTNNYDIGGYFRSNVSSSGLAELEVRGLK